MTIPHLGRVLVVDDDATVLGLCDVVLRAEGWRVVRARDATEATAALAAAGEPFDCVVTDVHMPGADGYALLREIRARDEDVPVLLMTADPTLEGAIAALEGGAVQYLPKPFAPEALSEAVARAARRHGVSRMRRRSASLLGPLEGGTGDRDALDRLLTEAIARAWMAYQPIVEADGGRPYAFEALLRTDAAELRRPDLLLGAAERLGRIQEVGRAVRAAVARAADAAPAGALLFVNVHGLELADEELYAPTAPLSRIAGRVVLEITERVALDGVADAPMRIEMLRRLGYRIAVDDLGAGYAGLASLAALEPDVVKLDMSLIRGIDTHATKRRVVGAIATLCRELGSRIVAEGVETEAERATVIDAGVDLLQGYLIARPARELLAA